MTEPIILKFELNRKQMISANDRLHFQQKGKITRFLRELAHYEGMNVLKDYFGLPYTEDKPCEVRVIVYAPTKRKYDPPELVAHDKSVIGRSYRCRDLDR